ncbi:metallophosphoesterase [Bacillus sp. DNRA2]|uniref:metallophosphoesterase n=1 Tax=Bacillus sp. DNRA2 TaxID=2723053 RepID=UPI00145C6E76|nr:metallophosphoesterase [Bacillus sp. DNRA2]NMD70292.1 metallophosphoesterase [Bacillus sp. DNRA2]
MIIIGSVLGLAFLFIIYMLKEAFSNRVLLHHLQFNDQANVSSIRIFFISDIHRRIIAEKIISTALGKTDIVIIGGDLAEGNVPLSKVKRNLEKLSQLGPIYFVWGNNDYEIDINKFEALLLEQHVTILKNTATTHVSSNGLKVNLIGIDDLAQGEPDLERAINQAEKTGLRLLLSHNPKIIERISELHNIQLVLSGHTHGGQIRFLGFGMYENGGIKKVGNTLLFVSNGYGTTALPFRLGAKAQTHLITLSK